MRILTNEVLQRVKSSEVVIHTWMKNKEKSYTEPEECFEQLVKAGLYKYDSKNKAHYFREDLRNLRENNNLNIFTKIFVTQDAPGRPWAIKMSI